MSIIKKYSKTFIGLSALGLGAVSPVAHADTQVESYPDEIAQLISEAKSLGITVVEEPTTQVQNDNDLHKYYDELTKQLKDIIQSYKSSKSANDKAINEYEQAETDYQKALKSYEDAKKVYEEQVAEYERQSKAYEANQKAVQDAKTAYEKSLDKWNQSV